MDIKKYSNWIKIKRSYFFRFALGFLIVFIGIFGMFFFSNKKDIPSKTNFKENYYAVKALLIEPFDYSTSIIGHGIVRPVSSISLSSEIGGKIIFINQNFKDGGLIYPGEILFKIDEADSLSYLDETISCVNKSKNLVKKFKRENNIDLKRIKTLERSKIVMSIEFKKKKNILNEHAIGNNIELGNIEKKYLNICENLNKILKSISLYPIVINEAKISLKASETKFLKATNDLKKCELKSFFHSRIKKIFIQKGEIISPNKILAILTDDNKLEIEIFLNSEQVKKWLKLRLKKNALYTNHWFLNFKSILCRIVCEKDNLDLEYSGFLVRVTEFDKDTHTVKAIIKIDEESKINKESILPITEGMFCDVIIPGDVLTQIYLLPKESINFNNEVYIFDEKGRLKIIKVTIIKEEGDNIYVDTGLNPSDLIVITRLVNPLEGTLLKIDGKVLTQEIYG